MGLRLSSSCILLQPLVTIRHCARFWVPTHNDSSDQHTANETDYWNFSTCAKRDERLHRSEHVQEARMISLKLGREKGARASLTAGPKHPPYYRSSPPPRLGVFPARASCGSSVFHQPLTTRLPLRTLMGAGSPLPSARSSPFPLPSLCPQRSPCLYPR